MAKNEKNAFRDHLKNVRQNSIGKLAEHLAVEADVKCDTAAAVHTHTWTSSIICFRIVFTYLSKPFVVKIDIN